MPLAMLSVPTRGAHAIFLVGISAVKEICKAPCPGVTHEAGNSRGWDSSNFTD